MGGPLCRLDNGDDGGGDDDDDDDILAAHLSLGEDLSVVQRDAALHDEEVPEGCDVSCQRWDGGGRKS